MGRQQELFSTRCSPLKFCRVIKKLNSKEHNVAIKELGFDQLMKMKRMKLCHRLCKWVLDNFDVKCSTFTVGNEVVHIGPEDVVRIFGLPSEGGSVLKPVHDIDTLCKRYSINVEKDLNVNALQKDLENVSPQSIEFKAKFVLFAVGTLFCPKSDNWIGKQHMCCLNDEVMSGRANWAEYVYNYLLSGISAYQSLRERRSVGGCIIILQVNGYPYKCIEFYEFCLQLCIICVKTK